ncbi:hypothetical protein [Neogemmobacter tilapiae]|uniref:Uncharacterized protein n=1 Tax=Neogemmobacter tilapiae TaxID=875041 RepID=A0A918TLZ0_9RHOB|nr:hypothetical protein [Gemmobacter tilapiae]GHC53673.1 hypothetical protein GCM10007315_15530 [Gemmobacter tilapiae]
MEERIRNFLRHRREERQAVVDLGQAMAKEGLSRGLLKALVCASPDVPDRLAAMARAEGISMSRLRQDASDYAARLAACAGCPMGPACALALSRKQVPALSLRQACPNARRWPT